MKKKILFIGNSYTYFHDMPERIFAPMAERDGCDFEVRALTHGGYKLCWYADPENEEGKRLREVIADRHFDCIVLQDHCAAVNTAGLKAVSASRSLSAVRERSPQESAMRWFRRWICSHRLPVCSVLTFRRATA